MAITVEARTEIIALVVGMFGAAPGASVLSDLVAAKEAGMTLKGIAASISNTVEFKSIYPTFMTNAEFATKLVNNLVGSLVPDADKAAAAVQVAAMLTAGASRSSVVVDVIAALNAVPTSHAVFGAAALAFDNKVDVAVYYSVDKQLSGSSLAGLQSVISSVTNSADSVTAAKASIDGTASAGGNFTLTVGADSFTGTSGNDTFNGSQTTANTWTVGDVIDGGAGTDTFNVTQTAAITVPVGVTVKNIEIANLLSGTTGNVVDTTSWAGLTALNLTGVTAQTVTAAATTDVVVTASTATGATAINGGKNVTVTETGANAGTVNVGATTAAAGAVSVSSTGSTAGGTTGNGITVRGGTEISITQKGGNAVNTTNTDGAVTVTGTAITKTVTVISDKAATASATVVGRVNGTVGITDVNAASTTAAGAIETVSVTNAGAVTVNSGALKTLNLAGTITSVNAGTLGALTTPANTALAVNVNGLTTTGAVTVDADIKTLNINSSTAATTVASLVASGATTVNVAGDAALTLTDQTLGAVTAITVTNTAGATFGTTAIGAGVTFTGGAGADSVVLSNAFTKAITMGAGNDTVTYGGAAGTGGSVAAGEGTDRIIMTDAQASAADGSSVFNSKFTGFEILRLSDALAGGTTLDLDGLNAVTTVELAAGGANATTSIIDNLASGGTVDIRAASTGVVVQVDAAVAGAADTLNVKLTNSTAATVAFGSVTAANVETINISTVDIGTGANAAATVDTATLVATAATSVVVSGNNGLTLTNTGNTAITSFDASGVVANGTTDTAANLAVTFASANTTASATVTIKGGAGNDTLTGNASKDNITGGAGNDLINGGTSQDTITVGVGRDIVQIVNNDDDTAGDIIGSGTAAADIVNGFTLVDAAISAVDFSSNANFQGSTAGGANLSLLNLDVTADDAGVGAGTNLALAVEANGTGAGQSAGVTYTVSNGILSLSGAGASTVDTLGEWLTEVAAVAATAGDVLGFRFGSDTYVFAQNGTADVLVQLVGIAGTSLVEVSNSTTASAGAILFADL